VAAEDPAACAECGKTELTQDEDVLDTWFSSQLWPYSTLGWPDETPELASFYPNEALVTGYEILYLWVARMIMSGLFLVGDVPFRNAVIHGLVRDGQGRKMSKSLGNVIDPIEMIDRYGADALRFSLARSATGGQQDIPLSEDAIEAGRHFANKIWNASRLVLRSFEGGEPELPPAERRTVAERWLLSRHQACLAEVDAALDEYRFADAAQALQRFTWAELCDWGLELEKGRLDGTEQERADAAALLGWVLERTLRLLHPTMPFVTEEIWQRFGVGESITIAVWPEPHPEHRDEGAESSLGLVQEVVTALRQFRAQHHIPNSQALAVTVGVPDAHQPVLGELAERIGRMTGTSDMTVVPGDAPKVDGALRAVVSGGFVEIPLAGAIDLEAERARLSKRLGELDRDIERSGTKLANEGFRAKAAPEIVAGEQDKLTRLTAERDQIFAQLGELG
jgi:valyl-tRNA synthetase